MSEENLARRFKLDTTPERIFFRMKHADEPPNQRNGKQSEAGTVAVGWRGVAVDDRTDGASLWRSLSITVTELTLRADILTRRSPLSLLGSAEIMRPSPEAFERLVGLQRAALRLAAEAPEVLAHPTAARLLDEQLGEALLDMMASNIPDRERLADRRHHAIMRKVLPFLEANQSRPIALTELCKIGGCSARLLETVFLSLLGRTPNRHLRVSRLWGARRALSLARSTEATVSQIAFAWGFWELGRFALAYRQLFGESPSQTLRREPI